MLNTAYPPLLQWALHIYPLIQTSIGFWLGDIIPSLARSLAKPHRINSSITLCLLHTDDFAQESPLHSAGYKDMNECKLVTISSELFFFEYLSYHLSNCSRQRFRIVIVTESFDLARGASPFCLDSQVLLLFYTLFLAAEKDLGKSWQPQHRFLHPPYILQHWTAGPQIHNNEEL